MLFYHVYQVGRLDGICAHINSLSYEDSGNMLLNITVGNLLWESDFKSSVTARVN